MPYSVKCNLSFAQIIPYTGCVIMKRVEDMDVRFPIGELELPNKVTLVDVKQWMSEVETYIDQLKMLLMTYQMSN